LSNPRITSKDKALIKGAPRRAFSRSKLRQEVLESSVVKHTDLSRPKVKTWLLCNVCKKPEAKSYMVVDHIEPYVKVTDRFENMSMDEAVDRLWCEKANLQTICPSCHTEKSLHERRERAKYKKENKK
jgi:5-methylcytosine-specific restriction endonuclease McrA